MKKRQYSAGLILLLVLSMGFSSCYMGYYDPGPRYNNGPRYRNYGHRHHPPPAHHHHHGHRGYR